MEKEYVTSKKFYERYALVLTESKRIGFVNDIRCFSTTISYFVVTDFLSHSFTALYGILFPGKEEASYSNFRLWESTGSVITYAYSPYLCLDVKLYLLLGLLIIGAIGYTSVEFIEWKGKHAEPSLKGEFKLVKSAEKSGEVAE